MKKYFKKIGAALVSALMMVGMTASAFAAEVNVPLETDKAVVTVKNVEAGATVTGYKIVAGSYGEDGKGLTGYGAVEGVEIVDVTAPTESEIGKIAKAIGNGTVSLERHVFSGVGRTYTAEVPAGSYLVLVTGTAGGTIYNPMVVSAGYGTDSVLEGGEVSGDGTYTIRGETAYAKSSTPELEKEIVGSGSGNDHGDDLEFGDKAEFKITTQIPSYSEQYEHATFVITDSLSAGLASNKDMVVKVDGEKVDAPDVTMDYGTDGSETTVTFASDYILANGLKQVEIVYSAKVTDKAGVNFDANTNKAVLNYTNDPAETSDGEPKTGTIEDITYHYTFGIGAELGGTTSESTQKTHEIIKVNEDGRVTTTTVNDGIDTIKTEGALAGAVFTLTNTETNKVYTAESDVNGYLEFKGLDAGSYTLVEKQAPEGYTLDTTPHEVMIEAVYRANGQLESYSVQIDGKVTSTYTAHYDAERKMTEIKAEDQTVTIKNTSIKSLPSTGGIGTYLFTIAGVIIMAVAAGMFFAKRKK